MVDLLCFKYMLWEKKTEENGGKYVSSCVWLAQYLLLGQEEGLKQ